MWTVDTYLKEELVAGDLLDEFAWVGSIELDPEVEGDGAHPLDLLRHSLRRVQPMLQNIQRSDAGCGSFCMIRMKEVTGTGGMPIASLPCVSVLASCYYVRLHRLMEMFAADFHREGGVTGSGTPGGPRPMHKAGTGAGDAEARAPAADLNSDNMGDCHHGEVGRS